MKYILKDFINQSINFAYYFYQYLVDNSWILVNWVVRYSFYGGSNSTKP